MTSILENVIAEVAKEAPSAPAAQIAEAAVETVANPSPASILNDIEVMMNTVKIVKQAMAGTHPTVKSFFMEILKALL